MTCDLSHTNRQYACHTRSCPAASSPPPSPLSLKASYPQPLASKHYNLKPLRLQPQTPNIKIPKPLTPSSQARCSASEPSSTATQAPNPHASVIILLHPTHTPMLSSCFPCKHAHTRLSQTPASTPPLPPIQAFPAQVASSSNFCVAHHAWGCWRRGLQPKARARACIRIRIVWGS